MNCLPINGLLMAATTSEVQWRLRADWPWVPWFTVLFVALVAGLVFVCYRAELSPAGRSYRLTLGLLRLTTIGLLLAMLSGAIWAGVRTGRPKLAVLVDQSESMLRRDVIRDEQPNQPPIQRETAARQMLAERPEKLLERLAASFDLELYTVDSDWRRDKLTAPTPSDSEPATTEIPADRSATRLGDAIAAALETGGPALRAVVTLSDGQVTKGRSLSVAADSARRLGVPLYFIGIGSEDSGADVELSDLRADDRGYADDLVRFQATLRTQGLAGKPVRLELLRRDNETAEPVVLSSQTLKIDGPTATLPIDLLDRPAQAGRYVYTLRVSTTESGPTSVPVVSELSHTLNVSDEPLRVLLAAGYPNYEFRYLKQLLERDDSIRLATVLQEADPRYADTDLTALRRFPNRVEDLDEYEALVLIDLDPTLLPRSAWDGLADFVGDRGGGLALIAGPRGLPAAIADREAFAALCPTQLSTASAQSWNEPAGFRVAPTSLGTQEPAFLLTDTTAANLALWDSLAPLFWRADIGQPKPAASVLAVAQGAAGSPPVIVAQRFGAGRVILHAIDSTWRWRFRVGDVYFARYWGQTLRTLARGKRSTEESPLRVDTDRTRYQTDESIVLRVRQSGRRDEQTPLPELTVRSDDGVERRVTLEATSEGYRGTLSSLPAGRYRGVVAALGETPSAAAVFEVQAPRGEAAQPQMNRQAMSAAAERTRGRFLLLEAASMLPEVLPTAVATPLETLPPRELWNRWPLLAGIVGCLVSEWILRKRRSML